MYDREEVWSEKSLKRLKEKND